MKRNIRVTWNGLIMEISWYDGLSVVCFFSLFFFLQKVSGSKICLFIFFRKNVLCVVYSLIWVLCIFKKKKVLCVYLNEK
jgi:hypothetical protein